MELLVLHIPGLSARLLRDQAAAAVDIARVGGEGSAATLVTIDAASPRQLEATLLTGLPPEYLGEFAGGVGEPRATPFWVNARRGRTLSARVQPGIELPPHWRATDPDPQLLWLTLDAVIRHGPGRDALREVEQQARPLLQQAQSAVVLSAWSFNVRGEIAQQACDPLDRPVLLARGIEQTKACIGILEIAGLLERALTGEVLRDNR